MAAVDDWEREAAQMDEAEQRAQDYYDRREEREQRLADTEWNHTREDQVRLGRSL